jgi:excisionase family DNA binding protein
MEQLFYTTEEAASILKISRRKLYRLCKTKGFPAKLVGSEWRIPVKALEKWAMEY